MNYGQPHGVLLFFNKGMNWECECRTACLIAQQKFYHSLQQQGKVLQTGQLVHGAGLFISLSISSDSELCAILENDPALKAEIVEVVHAVPVMF
jgi:hypothetical protein